MIGWRAGLAAFSPVIEGEKLYGRGAADDGYAVFASLAALEAVQRFGGHHRRAVVLIETCEESGSFDLPHYIDALAGRIGSPSLVVCLDSGCGNYEQLWGTTSLRGLVSCMLRVDVLSEGVHSGDASGIVPSSFRLLRQLLSRLEDQATGEVLLDALNLPIPSERRQQAEVAAGVLGKSVYEKFPFHAATAPQQQDLTDLILARTWRATLSVTGAEGFPAVADAGNVLRPYSALKLSFRLPPCVDAQAAVEAITETLTNQPPANSSVTLSELEAASGWNAPALAPWLEQSVNAASMAYFERPAVYMGEGGSIPFMAMLGAKFPDAQFFITGVLGPGSNAHGPNEFLHLPTGKRLTCAVARVLSDHFHRTA
jgi:acetylornithine deacetylase/succinyl-diaminopimelate desuccinylase-like protein